MNKILIIEDDTPLLTYMANLLKLGGYEVLCASNGRTGLQMAFEEEPDLIISDIILSGIDGYKILSELQKDEFFAGIPFIFVTGKSERTDFRKGMDLGADDYIVKPFTDSELLNAVSSRLRKRKISHTGKASFRHSSTIKKTQSNFSQTSAKLKKKLSYDDRILLSIEKNPKLVKIDTIKCISAVGDYSHVVTADSNKFFVRKPMKEWESILPDSSFIRIHRSTIINLEFVQNIEKWFNNIYKVFIKGVNKPFYISRRYGSKLKSTFGLFKK